MTAAVKIVGFRNGTVMRLKTCTGDDFGGGWQLREGNAFVDTDTLETMRERTDWGNLIDQ